MKTISLLIISLSFINIKAQYLQQDSNVSLFEKNNKFHSKPILPGAYQIDEYKPLIKDKRVGLFTNQTSVIENTHLVDTLTKLSINIIKIFSPEHGLRGTADAGEQVYSYIDKPTGIQVISLYGKKTKPSVEDLKDVDVLVFDIQDVGVRFYTYISSLQYFMESAIENNKPLIILDRPNPNGFYVDGPVLDTAFKSFIGMQPVPVVYGMTIGEYGKMLYGEKMLSARLPSNKKQKIQGRDSSSLIVIRCKNYTHDSRYILNEKPSPNLAAMGSIYWYPSTCFFEGTAISEGRGTDHPFQIFGHPNLPDSLYRFTPHSTTGAKEPKFKDQLCYGWNLCIEDDSLSTVVPNVSLQLKWLLQAYQLFPDKENFFIHSKKTTLHPPDYFFNKLAGNAELMQQIKDGKTEEEIRQSWQAKLDLFKKIRKKYLLYPDFTTK